jgi:hypothetical protein
MEQRLVHYPNLKTVIMVENTMKKMDDSIFSLADLKRALPKKINHNTLVLIVEYLEDERKVVTSIKGITWIENSSPKLARLVRNSIAH